MIWGPEQTTASVVAVMLNVLVGAGWVICFARFITAQDDLWRKIMQDAWR